MGKIVSKVRQLRLNYQAQLGRTVTIEEVAEQLGIDRKRLTQIELGKMERLSTEEMVKLCEFYGVGLDQVLEYSSNKTSAYSCMVPA